MPVNILMARTAVFLAGLWMSCFPAATHAQEMVTLSTRSGVTQSYFLTSAPKELQAVAILFAGSGGLIKLRTENGQTRFGQGNFLVRSRSEFVKRGVISAIVDAPSDQQGGRGMSDEFRLGNDHYTDMAAVVSDLARRIPGMALYLKGTSRGSTSAAALGARFGSPVAGVILTSTMFRQAGRKANEPGIGLSKFDFVTIKAPVRFVHHVSDQCEFTPYSDAARLSDRYPLITVFGGKPPQSGPCDAFSQHGFFGKEAETVEQIVNWMTKKPFLETVK
jgi:hypothetical protein